MSPKISKDTIIFIVIYLVAFTIMQWYSLTHPLVNDRVYEYRDYLANIASGGWEYRNSSTNSSIIPIFIPYLIQRWTGWDVLLTFRVFPPFLYALMPAFVYLIARRFLDIKYAIMPVLVVISSSYISYFPDVGRVGIALGFLAGMVWSLLERKLLWAVVFAVAVVFSHYGTAVIAIGLSCVVLGVSIIWQGLRNTKWTRFIIYSSVVFLVLVISTGVWHFGIAKYSGDTMVSTILQPEEARAIMGEDWGKMQPLHLEDTDIVAQKAFGLTLGVEPIPGKIEIATNWLLVAFITLGLYLMLRKKAIDTPFKIMTTALYGLIIMTIAIPQFSIYYGTIRVYFTALILLAVCFPFGIKWVADKTHLSPLLLASTILVLYVLSTSGIIYLPFGLTKILPVAVSLP